jgi:hypothetical protein
MRGSAYSEYDGIITTHTAEGPELRASFMHRCNPDAGALISEAELLALSDRTQAQETALTELRAAKAKLSSPARK